MKTAGVAIDKWKLNIFKEHLAAGGWKYEVKPGITEDTLWLHVQYEWVATLKPVIDKAEAACRAARQKAKRQT